MTSTNSKINFGYVALGLGETRPGSRDFDGAHIVAYSESYCGRRPALLFPSEGGTIIYRVYPSRQAPEPLW